MAKKVVAVVLMCIVVFAAVHVHATESEEAYKSCFNNCEKKCEGEGNGYTLCEMKCDSECAAQELKAKLDNLIKS